MGRLNDLTCGFAYLLSDAVYIEFMSRKCNLVIDVYEKYLRGFELHGEIAERMDQVTNLILASGLEAATFAWPVITSIMCAKILNNAINSEEPIPENYQKEGSTPVPDTPHS